MLGAEDGSVKLVESILPTKEVAPDNISGTKHGS